MTADQQTFYDVVVHYQKGSKNVENSPFSMHMNDLKTNIHRDDGSNDRCITE